MAIKTDALQQNAAPKGADTLLMAASAGGTAQLSLARLAELLTGQDNAVRTALSNKAALSAQQTVEQNTVSTRSVTVTAAELPVYIKSLPRLLTDYIKIRVSAGTVNETVGFNRFYGPGAIWLVPDEDDGEVVLREGIAIDSCSAYIRVIKMKLRGNPNGHNAFVEMEFCSCVSLEQIDIDGSGTSDKFGVYAVCSKVGIVDCTVKNVGFAVSSAVSSVLSANNLTGSGNTFGGRVYRGGAILLGDSTPNLMGGASNLKQGGLIVGTDGTLL